MERLTWILNFLGSQSTHGQGLKLLPEQLSPEFEPLKPIVTKTNMVTQSFNHLIPKTALRFTQMSRPDDTLLLESYHMNQTKKSIPRETPLSGKHQHLFFLLTHFLTGLLLQWVILRDYILELFYFTRSTFKALNLIKLFFQFTCKNLVISTSRLTWNLISQLIPTRCLLHIITFYISSNSSILTVWAACSIGREGLTWCWWSLIFRAPPSAGP